ncbi:MAG: hypothetical protein BroJett011_07560 [Chloroflexota bacterium]|nr:MAG: hypothetical protein BroJett011_07560 [Chloroflexota bacterium]
MTNQEHPLTCPNCGGQLKLNFEFYVAREGDLTLNIHDTPFWHCPDCEYQALHPKVEKAIQDGFRTLQAQGQTAGTCTGTPPVQKFPFETRVDFEYDSQDHYLFPGLVRPDGTGYLTPVFFRLEVLDRYVHDPNYTLKLISESYGTIGYQNQWDIAFGLNRAKRVIMWLGDLAELPEDELYYLRAFNTASDHDLASEFYEGQINLQFTEPSLERQLLRLRFQLEQLAAARGVVIYQLQVESLDAARDIQRPIHWTNAELETVISALNKVVIEAFNVGSLRADLLTVVPAETIQGMRGLRLFQSWLSEKLGCSNAADLACPLFVLYDLRSQVYSHLTSQDTKEEAWVSCCDRLGLDPANTTPEQLYITLLERLNLSLTEICEALDQQNGSTESGAAH